MRRWLWIALGCAVVGIGGAVALLFACVTINVPLRGPGGPLALAQLRERLVLPQGFEVDAFAQGLPGPRFLRFTPKGDLLVSSPGTGAVLRLEPDRDGDGRTDGVHKLIGDLASPHGLDLFENWLYIGEGNRVRRVRFDAEAGAVVGEPQTVVPDLPVGGNHWTRTVRFGPDGKLYVSVGSSCNVCEEQDERRAAILRYEPDGSGYTRFASGLRNSVGFDFEPRTGALYATDNGRDLLGDDFPPCELNRVVEGGFYGWPYAHGDRVPDPEFGAGHEREIAQSTPPAHGFGAHTAPLGITFYRGSAFPEPYRSSAYVAQHGSWNRSRKSGYRVVRLQWDASGAISESDFAVGFERNEDVIGRPVDVAGGPDGALYVSDDYAGAIYRVRYTGPAAPAAAGG